jgi:hypothetical protein
MSRQEPVFVRENFPFFVKWLNLPQTLDQFANEGKKVNWNWVNEVETNCGLPVFPCANHPTAQRWELTGE